MFRNISVPVVIAVLLPACGSPESFDPDGDAPPDDVREDTASDVPADVPEDVPDDPIADPDALDPVEDPAGDEASDTSTEELPPATGSIAGTAYAPGPITGVFTLSGVLVYVTHTLPTPVPDLVHCFECSDLPTEPHQTYTGADGTFRIDDIPAGTWDLVVEKGGFRRTGSVDVVADITVTVPEADTTLPSAHVPSSGDFTPSIALALGSYDETEDVLAKLGLCDLDSEYHAILSTCDHIDFFDNGGGPGYPSFESLLRNPTQMDGYHVILVPCSSGTTDSALSDPTVLASIRDWVSDGGSFFVADWSYDLVEQVFPEYIDFEGDDSVIGSADLASSSYDTDGRAAEADLRSWLEYSLLETPDTVRFDEVWDCVAGLASVPTPAPDGSTVTVTPETYCEGPITRTHACMAPQAPHTMTFPYGCGRVLYNTFHTAGAMGPPHPGLLLQEEIMVYMLIEVGLCI